MQQLLEYNLICQNDIFEIVYCYRIQNYFKGSIKLQHFFQSFNDFFTCMTERNDFLVTKGIEINQSNVTEILSGIMAAQEQGDFLLVGDLLELQMKPWLLQIQEQIIYVGLEDGLYAELLKKNMDALDVYIQNMKKMSKDEFADYLGTSVVQREDIIANYESIKRGFKDKITDVIMEPTSSGALTLKIIEDNGEYYLHSNDNPFKEAYLFAKEYYNITKDHFVLYGMGLGYCANALVSLDDGIFLEIFEESIEVIQMAMYYMDLSWLFSMEHRCILWYAKEYNQMICSLEDKDIQLILHKPSMRNMKNQRIKEKLENIFIRDSGIRNMGTQLRNNFRDNSRYYDRYIDEEQNNFKGKRAVIVAAGPSLDKNVALLKQKMKDLIIVAVGTVYRKLIRLGIAVDYVVFLDGQPTMMSQLEGIDKLRGKGIFAGTAYKGLMKNFQGDKLLVCQKDYDLTEKFAKEHGYRTYATGGSVSTIALDICIQMECKSVAFIGLDLAFTDCKAHATNTSNVESLGIEEMQQVPAINGGMVATSKVFLLYKKWIENRVKQEDILIPIYDATEGGVVLEGLKNVLLKEYLEI